MLKLYDWFCGLIAMTLIMVRIFRGPYSWEFGWVTILGTFGLIYIRSKLKDYLRERNSLMERVSKLTSLDDLKRDVELHKKYGIPKEYKKMLRKAFQKHYDKLIKDIEANGSETILYSKLEELQLLRIQIESLTEYGYSVRIENMLKKERRENIAKALRDSKKN